MIRKEMGRRNFPGPRATRVETCILGAMHSKHLLSAAFLVALGVGFGGYFAGQGVLRARTAERYVTVKGSAEREVTASLAIWPLRLSVSGNDLARAQAKMASDVAAVRAFLARHGLDSAEVSLQEYSVNDAHSQQYMSERVASRYVIRQTMLVRSGDPERVLAASQKIGELVDAGVVLSSGNEYGGGGPAFLFKGVNELKPALIAEATAQARAAAEQFARDAGSRIAGIRRANQGLVEIRARDEAQGIREENQVSKTVRVVTTVEYLLK